jgi:hypothetical protein
MLSTQVKSLSRSLFDQMKPPLCRTTARWGAAAVMAASGTSAALSSGCAPGPNVYPARVPTSAPAPAPVAGPATSLVRIGRPDYTSPASVAAAFFTAWASIDATHDTQRAYLARCAPLVTPTLRRQLATNQPSPAEWQEMRRARLVSLVHVQAITRPAGAPPASRTRVFLRIYAERVTTTPGRHAVLSDGATVQLDRIRGRWLVARLVFW